MARQKNVKVLELQRAVHAECAEIPLRRVLGSCHYAHANADATSAKRTYLDDEVADDAAVVGVHAGAEGVEDAGHAHLQAQLRLVRVPVPTTSFGSIRTSFVQAPNKDRRRASAKANTPQKIRLAENSLSVLQRRNTSTAYSRK
jgi:hypothetical protein